MDGPDALQKEEDAPRHPVTHSMRKDKKYLAKCAVMT